MPTTLQQYMNAVQQRLQAAETADVIEPSATAKLLNVLGAAAEPDSPLPAVGGDGEGGAALFWSVGGTTLEVEFHAGGSHYMRLKPNGGARGQSIEGTAAQPFSVSMLSQHLRELTARLAA